MSWNFNFTSANKESLKEAIATQEYCAPGLCAMLEQQVEQMTIEPGMAINVVSSGHHDTTYAHGDFKVQRTRLL